MVDQQKIEGIIAERDGNIWTIFGDTFEHRYTLGRNQCKWQYKDKTWQFTGDKLPASVAEILTEVRIKEADEQQVFEQEETRQEPQKIARERKPRAKRAQAPRLVRSKRENVKRRKLTVVKPLDTNMVKPSYWDKLCTYLDKTNSRPVIALVGPAGNGKTTTAQAALSAMGYEYVTIPGKETLEDSDLIARLTYHPAQGEIWRDGMVTAAFREGKAVIIDEFDALNPRAAMCLQTAFQDRGFDGKSRFALTPGAEIDRVYPVGPCPIVLTMNTYGDGPNRMYVGRNALDAASMDRITVISTSYENEYKILRNRGYKTETCKQIESWAKGVRKNIEKNALRVILSPRTLLRIAQSMDEYGWSFEASIEAEFFDRIQEEDRSLLRPKEQKPAEPAKNPFGRRSPFG